MKRLLNGKTPGMLLLATFGCSLVWAGEAGATINISFCSKATGTPTCVSGAPNASGELEIAPSTPFLDPPGTPVIKIENISGSDKARVYVDDSGSTDKLALRGAKITFEQAKDDLEIEIIATGFQSGPNLTSSPAPNYRLTATNQTFKRGAAGANLDIVKAKGWLTPSGGSANQIGDPNDALNPTLVKYIYTNSFYFFNGSYLDELVGHTSDPNRDLKITLWLTAKNLSGIKDIVTLPGNGVELKNTTGAGGGEKDPSDCDACKCEDTCPKVQPCEPCEPLPKACLFLIIGLAAILAWVVIIKPLTKKA